MSLWSEWEEPKVESAYVECSGCHRTAILNMPCIYCQTVTRSAKKPEATTERPTIKLIQPTPKPWVDRVLDSPWFIVIGAFLFPLWPVLAAICMIYWLVNGGVRNFSVPNTNRVGGWDPAIRNDPAIQNDPAFAHDPQAFTFQRMP